MRKADNFDAKQWLVENKITFQSRLNEDENLPTRAEIFDDFKKMAQDLEAKTGAKITTIRFPNTFRFHVEGDMMGWWDGQFDVSIARLNPSPLAIKRAYEDVNKWVANFPAQYKDYLSWKAKGEEAFNQEVNRRRKEYFGDDLEWIDKRSREMFGDDYK